MTPANFTTRILGCGLLIIAWLTLLTAGLSAAPDLLTDGPYVLWNSDGSAQVEAVCDSKIKTGEIPSSKVLSHPCSAKVLSPLVGVHNPPPDSYNAVDRIFALSDVEGHYDDLIVLLRNHDILDSDLRWNFGTGHLVFLGDMMDRGDQVTEVLWLIYRLEGEALAAGGRVHYVLGNHEKMNLEGDLRYLNPKYKQVSKILGRSYDSLYGANTELGRWLRSRNAIVKLNDMLFVHGGLAPDLPSYARDIRSINQGIRMGLKDPASESDPNIGWLMSSDGPLWYRGYFKDQDLGPAEIRATLWTFQAKRIVVGHTIVPQVDFLHDGAVIAIDSSFAKTQNIQALLIDSQGAWRAAIDGRRQALQLP